MKCIRLSLYFLYITWLGVLSCDLVTGSSKCYSCSIADLEGLALSDIEIVEKFILVRNAVSGNSVSPLIRHMDMYLKDFYAANGNSTKWGDLTGEEQREAGRRISNNPISAYRLIRRYAYYLPYIMQQAKNLTGSEFQATQQDWPDQDDIDGALAGILRLHHVYNFKASDFARGNISGILTEATLNAVHCYELGHFAKDSGFFSLSIDWLELAQELALVDGTMDLGYITSELIFAKKVHDEEMEQAPGWEPLFYTMPFSQMHQFYSNKSARIDQQIKRRQQQYDAYKGKRENNFVGINFWGLCSGENYQTEYEKSLLFCWLERKVDLYYLIGPIKMEFLSQNPDVVQIYDAIGDELVERLKAEAETHFERSMVVNFNKSENTDRKLISGRNSMNGWIDDLDPLWRSIPQSIQAITGLVTATNYSAEMLQIASYTFTGQYESHLDSLISESVYKEDGDRIATYMLYLSDVEEGGFTAFTQIGVAAKPVKNSAIFWFDITSDGLTDYATYHGACPLLIGRKYVGNKWVRYFDQFSKFKCTLKPHDRYHVPVNGVIMPNPKRDQEFSPAVEETIVF